MIYGRLLPCLRSPVGGRSRAGSYPPWLAAAAAASYRWSAAQELRPRSPHRPSDSGGTVLARLCMSRKVKRGFSSLPCQIACDDRYWKRQGERTDEIEEYRLEHYAYIASSGSGADGATRASGAAVSSVGGSGRVAASRDSSSARPGRSGRERPDCGSVADHAAASQRDEPASAVGSGNSRGSGGGRATSHDDVNRNTELGLWTPALWASRRASRGRRRLGRSTSSCSRRSRAQLIR